VTTRALDALQGLGAKRQFLFVLLGIYVVSRVGTWAYPFDSDHWIFFYVGKNWFHGGSLYVTAWDHKPPLIFLFNGLMSVALGSNIVLHRLLFTLMSLVDIYLFYRLLTVISPDLVGLLDSGHRQKAVAETRPAAGPERLLNQLTDPLLRRPVTAAFFTQVALVLYVFWRDLSQFASSGNNTENFAMPFLLGMILAYLSFRSDANVWKLALSGACLSVLFFLKGNFLLLGLPIVLLLVFDYRKQPKRLLAYLLSFAAPLVAQTACWFAYFGHQGTVHQFLVAGFLFSSKYAGSAWGGDVSSLRVRLELLFELLLLLIPSILLAVVFVRNARNSGGNRTHVLLAMLSVAVLAATLDVGSWYPYYFLIAMPVFAIVLAYGIFASARFKTGSRQLLTVLILSSIFFSLGVSMKQALNSFSGSAYASAQEYKQVAAYVRAHTSPRDRVFAYDYGATFYQLSGRDSGSRFVSASVLLLDYRDHYGFGLNALFIADMRTSKAKYVVLSREPDVYSQNKPVMAYFKLHYRLEKTFSTLEVLRRVG